MTRELYEVLLITMASGAFCHADDCRHVITREKVSGASEIWNRISRFHCQPFALCLHSPLIVIRKRSGVMKLRPMVRVVLEKKGEHAMRLPAIMLTLCVSVLWSGKKVKSSLLLLRR